MLAIPALFCWLVLLKVPSIPPFAGTRLVIDHAPVVALPPTLAPVNMIAVGVADWQAVLGPPGVTVAAAVTVTEKLTPALAHPPELFLTVRVPV